MIKRSILTIPAILFLLSFLLRVSLISKGPFHVDCLNLTIFSEEFLKTGRLPFLFGSGYPLTILLGGVFVFGAKLLGVTDPVTAVNFMSVLFSSLCIPLYYVIVKRLINDNTALLSAILLCVSPIFLGLSVFGKSQIPNLFFLLLSILFLLRFQQTQRNFHLGLSILWMGCMGATRVQDFILMIIPVSVLLFIPLVKNSLHSDFTKKRFSKFLVFWLLSGLIVALFHLPYIYGQGGYGIQLNQFWQSGVSSNFRGLFSNSLIRCLNYLVINYSQVGFVGLILGLIWLAIDNRRLLLFCGLWIALPLFFYGNLYSTVPRFLLLTLPPLTLILANLFDKLLRLNTVFRTSMIFIFTLIFFITFNFIYPSLKWRHNHALLPEYTQWVARQIPENSRVIGTDDSLFFKHYADIDFLARPLSPFALTKTDLSDFKQRLDQALNENIPVYITATSLLTYDKSDQFSALIFDHYTLSHVGSHLYESWHRGILDSHVFYNHLYRITAKAP